MITSFLPKGRTCPPAATGPKCTETQPASFTKTAFAPTLPQFQGGDHFVRSNSSNRHKIAQPQFAGRATVIRELTEASHPNEVMDTDDNTWLHYGVRAGKLDLVKKWLKVPDVNYNLLEGENITPLTACAITNRPDMLAIAKELRAAGAQLQALPRDYLSNYTHGKKYTEPSDIAKAYKKFQAQKGVTIENQALVDYFLEEEKKDPWRLILTYDPADPKRKLFVIPKEIR